MSREKKRIPKNLLKGNGRKEFVHPFRGKACNIVFTKAELELWLAFHSYFCLIILGVDLGSAIQWLGGDFPNP